MGKIRVLHIVRSPSGGIRRHVSGIAVLSQETCENFLATDGREADPSYKPSQFSLVKELKIPSAPHPLDLFNLFFIACFVLRERIDILHGHGAKGGLYARVLGFFLRKPSVYTAHGGSLHTMFSPVMNFFYTLVEKILYYPSSALIFESQYCLSQYQRRIHQKSSKFFLNYNGIAFSPLGPSKELGSPMIIGAFGMLRKAKGYDVLIHAVSRLPNSMIHLHGSGEEREELLKLAKELKVELQIFEGTRDVESAMRKCDIIVQPSRFESFGYVPLEAMALGIPVVASAVGGLCEVVTDGESGLLFPSENDEALSAKLKELIENKAKRESLRIRAWEISSKKFSEEAMVSKLLSLYRSLLRA